MDKKQIILGLQKEEKSLLEQLNAIRTTIAILSGANAYASTHENGASEDSVSGKEYPGYKTTASIREKVAQVLKNENRFLHYKQIVGKIAEMDGLNEQKKEKLRTSVLPAISALKSKGILTTVKVGNANVNTFYGSPKWLDQSGKPKTEHMYDESMVTLKQDYEI